MQKKNEVEFEISGGFGNQLFMLNAGLYFQKKSNRAVCFNISDLGRISDLHPGHNVYTLGLLKNSRVLNPAKKNGPYILIKRVGFFVFKKIFGSKKISIFRRVFISPDVGFIDLESIPSNTRKVKGYFQTWRYVSELSKDYALEIENNLIVSDWYFNQLNELTKQPFAAFHVRRGDYKLKINREMGILSYNFFERIEKLLPQDIPLLIFTDDVNEVIDEFNGLSRKFTIVNPPANSDPIESLLLMSKASFLAISNSTYSWWAAYLSSPETKVYAPSDWFQHRKDPIDLLPCSWTRIQSDWKY